MKSQFRSAVVVLLLASMSFAQATAPASAPAAKPRRKSARAAKPKVPAVTQEDILSLREMIQQQQTQLEQMRQEMARRDQQIQQAQQQLADAQTAARDTQTKVATVESTANETKQSFATVQSDVADIKGNMTNTAISTQEDQKRIGGIEGTLNRFRWSGDVRVRFETFQQDGVQDRYRPRIRLRLGVEGKLNENFVGGLALASGGLNDPTTTNSTLGDSFQRKPIALDRAYITYNPADHKWLSITGGKFAYTWARTSQTFDPDINPEGFSEKLSFDIKSRLVKNVSVTGLQLLLNETNGQVNNGSGLPSTFPKFNNDSWAYGAQFAGKLQLGSFWTMSPSYLILNFRNADSLVNGFANLVNGGSTFSNNSNITPAVITTTGFAPNGMTNAICQQSVSGQNLPRFCSQFLYSDLIVNNVIKTPMAKLPVNLLGEYLVNLNAASNNKHLYQAEVSLGQVKNKNDYQFGYAFTRSEQDAVIASFAESDQRFPTNVLQHRVFGSWKLAPNTTLSYTQWIGRALNTNLANTPAFGFGVAPTFKPYGFSPLTVPGGHEPWLKRGQLDLVYSF